MLQEEEQTLQRFSEVLVGPLEKGFAVSSLVPFRCLSSDVM